MFTVMASQLSSASPWRLKGNCAEFQFGSWNGSVDLTQPARGVEVHEPATIVPGGARVLGVEVGKPTAALGAPVDAYVRDADLVAVYAESPALPFGVQIYWSLADSGLSADSLRIDVIVSIQTQQLDVRAHVQTTSALTAAAIWLSANSRTDGLKEFGSVSAGMSRIHAARHEPWIVAELARPDGAATSGSYFEAAMPSDFLGADLKLSGKAFLIRRELLDETMEKGVIRRLWCRGIFARQGLQYQAAVQLADEFLGEKPRLTT